MNLHFATFTAKELIDIWAPRKATDLYGIRRFVLAIS